MKNYYGEKFAFYQAFLMHYQAWLVYPTAVGLAVTGYQIWRYIKFGDMDKALDSEANGFFGLFVAIWASLFIESWRRK